MFTEKSVDESRRIFQLNSPYGELNLLRKRNWLTPAKLPSAAKGEFNFALCDSTEFSCFVRNNFAAAIGGNLANNSLDYCTGSSPKTIQFYRSMFTNNQTLQAIGVISLTDINT